MHSWDMKVETPLPLTELEDRNVKGGHPIENQCSSCGIGSLDPWYPIEDVTVIRHWNIDSVDEPGGGHWTWYCPDHLARRRDNWWRSSHLAPAHLLPEITHDCAHIIGVKTVCGDPAVEPFDGIWLCERHAQAERVSRRMAELFEV